MSARARFRLLFEPRDIWIGAYIKAPYWEGPALRQEVYICLVPMLPILVTWTRRCVLAGGCT